MWYTNAGRLSSLGSHGTSPVKVGWLQSHSEDSRGGNMMVSLATDLLGRLLLGAPFVLGVFGGVQTLCHCHQRRGNRLHTHPAKNLPRLGDGTISGAPERDS
jgi:hypothetical protein